MSPSVGVSSLGGLGLSAGLFGLPAWLFPSAGPGLLPPAGRALPVVAAPAVAGTVRRRMESLVAASTNARASTPSPMSWAATTGAPRGSADVSATGLALARCPGAAVLDCGDGVSVGNRPPALPPGLSVELVPFDPFMPGE